MSVNLRDIAKKLNLSVATVSRALRNHSSVNPATRNLVLQAAAEMGYRQLTPRNEKNKKDRTKQLSVLAMVQMPSNRIPEPGSIHAMILAGMSGAAFDLDVSLHVHYVREEDLSGLFQPENQPAGMRRGQIDGLILTSIYDSSVLAELAKAFPCVLVHGYHRDLKLDYVGANNAEAISTLVERLYNLGHRRIGFVGCDPIFSWMQERQTGYFEAMIRLGLPLDPGLVIHPNMWLDPNGNTQMDRVVRKIDEGVSAWICASDGTGYQFYRALSASGISIPDQVSLAGFDAMSRPNDCKLLTSAREPCEDVGNEAVRRLVHRIRFPLASVSKVLYACDIIEGETETAYTPIG